MAKITNFRDLIGVIKDKASLCKAALLSAPDTLSVRLAVLRATTHSPAAPPDDRRLSALLLLGESSRAAAAPIIASVMDRLRRTGNCVVALKCLLVVHHVVMRGPFILQDQLSVFPSSGGRNYLKLSDFHDGATAAAWALSAWVRWYARYLETLLSASRDLGYFVCSCSVPREDQDRGISSSLNADLIRDVDSLVRLVEEVCEVPDYNPIGDKTIVAEIVGLLANDYLSLVNEIATRLGELIERLGCLSFGDSVELVCALSRLGDRRERMSVLYAVNKPSIETMWGLVEELKGEVGMLKGYREGGREGGKLLSLGMVSESARFDRRVFGKADSVKFQSGRFSCENILILGFSNGVDIYYVSYKKIVDIYKKTKIIEIFYNKIF